MATHDSKPVHTWLVLNEAVQAISRYAVAAIQAEGLGDSDFRVLEVLLHKGSLPVNVIGPKVNLTPASISVAVDRLYKRGLVSREESTSDRRVRMVDLTANGRKLIARLFAKHTALIDQVFTGLSEKEVDMLEASMRTLGRSAEALAGSETPLEKPKCDT